MMNKDKKQKLLDMLQQAQLDADTDMDHLAIGKLIYAMQSVIQEITKDAQQFQGHDDSCQWPNGKGVCMCGINFAIFIK